MVVPVCCVGLDRLGTGVLIDGVSVDGVDIKNPGVGVGVEGVKNHHPADVHVVVESCGERMVDVIVVRLCFSYEIDGVS